MRNPSQQRENYDFVGSYNNQRVSGIDAERTVNLFEYIDPMGKKPNVLLSTSGLVNTNVNFSPVIGGFRAQFVFQNNMYEVVGNGVFLISTSLARTLLGTLTTSRGYVGVDANTFQIIFVDGNKGYIWDTIAFTFSQITDQSFPAMPIDVCYLDGFFIIANGNTNTFQMSSYEQGMVWGGDTQPFIATTADSKLAIASTVNFATGIPVQVTTAGVLPEPLTVSTNYFVIQVDATHIRLATTYANAIIGNYITLITAGTPVNSVINIGQLQVGTMTTHPGTIVGCKTLHRRLFLFSQNYTEVWENAGLGTVLPVRRNNSLLMEYGLAAIGSAKVGFDMLIFLAQDKDGLGSVMMVTGTTSMPISNRALDFTLSNYAASADEGVADATAILCKESAIIFYRLNFTSANHTFVYNVSMSEPGNPRWHEEEVLNGDRHPAQTHAYFDGINYYGHYSLPILYYVDDEVFTNDGEAIRRMRIGRPIGPATYERRRIDRWWLDLLQGQANIIENTGEEEILWTESGFDITTENNIDLITESVPVVISNLNPTVFLSISKDGGQSYGPRATSPMGKLGERSFRTVWRKLGVIPRGQYLVPKVEFFQNLQFVVLGADWDFEQLPE